MYMYACVDAHVGTCGGQRLILECVPLLLSTILFETGSLTESEHCHFS